MKVRKKLNKNSLIIILGLAIGGLFMTASGADLTPSYNTFMVGNIYNTGMSADQAGVRWFADHYDFMLNGLSEWDELKGYNPNLEAAYYTNLQMMGNRTDGNYTGWEYKAFMRLFDSANIPAESAFVHFADSVVSQLLDGGSRTINIAALMGIGADSATRVSLRGWYNDASDSGSSGSGYFPAGDGDWFCNIESPTYRKFRAMAEKFIYQNQDSILGFANQVNYAYIDNFILDWGECTPGYWVNGGSRNISGSAGGPTGGSGWSTNRDDVDWDIQASILPNDASALRQPLWDVLGEVQDSMESSGFGGCIPNISSSGTGSLHSFVLDKQPAGLFFEYQGDNIVINDYAGGWNRFAQRHDTVAIADNGCMQFWEYRFAMISDTSSFNAQRLFMAALSSFLCMQNQGVDHFKFGKLDSDYWFKGHEVDIGAPVGQWFDSTKIDLAGGTNQKVIIRTYERGTALFRPKMSSGADTTANAGIYIDLGKPIYQIDANLDSTLVADGRVLIKAQQGVIVVDVLGPCGVPPSVPLASSPTNGSSQGLTPTLCVTNSSHGSCTDPVTYHFEISLNSGFSNPDRQSGAITEGAGTSCFTTSAPLSNGRRYYWRARAYNGTAYSGWSATRTFLTPNNPPTAPTGYLPAHLDTVGSLTPMLTVTNGTDPDGGTLVYYFEVSKFEEFSSFAAQSPAISSGAGTTAWQVTTILENNSDYYWRVRAYDGIDYGPWMDSIRFSIDAQAANNPPTQPTVSTPPNNATLTSTPVTLSWNNSIDADGHTLTYQAHLLDSAGSSVLDSASGIIQGNGATTSFSPSITLTNNQWYSWRTRAFDGTDFSAWMTVARFYLDTTIIVNQPPDPPTLTGPLNSDTMISLQISLVINSSFDAEGDDLSYDFAIYTDPSHTILVNSVQGFAFGQQGGSITWPIPSTLSSGGQYYWSARAFDGESYSSWAPYFTFWVFDFSVDAGQQSPTSLAPVSGAVLSQSQPSLTVSNVPISGLSNLYYFELSRDSQFVDRVLSGPINEDISGTTSWEVSTPLSNGVEYFWRTRANNSPYGEVSSFSIDANIYIAPNPYRPSSGHAGLTVFNMKLDGTLTITTVTNEIVRVLNGNASGRVTWDGKNENGEKLASDIYLCYYKGDGQSDKFKFVVIR